ncbi:MAG: Inositol 2-dehydrogenase, partial [Planctomycetota bacterium]
MTQRPQCKTSRRDVIRSSSLAAIASATAPYWFAPSSRAAAFKSPNERPVLGCIGTGDRWNAVGPAAMNFSDCAAVCDVDADHA